MCVCVSRDVYMRGVYTDYWLFVPSRVSCAAGRMGVIEFGTTYEFNYSVYNILFFISERVYRIKCSVTYSFREILTNDTYSIFTAFSTLRSYSGLIQFVCITDVQCYFENSFALILLSSSCIKQKFFLFFPPKDN